jgi:hypothetical protein
VPPLEDPQPLPQGERVGTATWPAGNTADGGQGQVVNTFTCSTVNLQYHRHAHLSIFRDGVQLAVPGAIGRPPGCTYGLHTHDGSGTLHLEPGLASVNEVNLGSLFAIWGQPLSYTNIAGITGLPVRVFVKDNGDNPENGGALFEYTGSLDDLQLISRREITVQIGATLTAIPTYDWGATE